MLNSDIIGKKRARMEVKNSEGVNQPDFYKSHTRSSELYKGSFFQGRRLVSSFKKPWKFTPLLGENRNHFWKLLNTVTLVNLINKFVVPLS